MSRTMDKIDAAVIGNTGCISAAFKALCEAGSQLKSVTRFISKDLRVRISRRRGCPGSYHLTVGKPNYLEREYLKRHIDAVWARSGSPVLASRVISEAICGLTMTAAAPTTSKRSKRWV